MDRYPQLQSGFLGQARQQLTKFSPMRDPFKDYTLDQDHMKPGLAYFYHEEATEVYRDLRKNPELVKDLKFIRRAIALAKKLFAMPNGNSVHQWFDIQRTNPALTVQHAKYLRETMCFVVSGKPRTVMQDLSYMYLYYRPRNTQYRGDVTWMDMFQHRVLETDNLVNVNTFITMWLSRPNGLTDMVHTCWVIYGVRDAIQDVSDKSMG